MKKRYLTSLAVLIALTSLQCTLDEGPGIPTGKSNIIDPEFENAGIVPGTNNTFSSKAFLKEQGNLNIMHHGWVWSESNESPTIDDDSLDLGPLTIDSFLTQIPGLDPGKVYYLRPYVITGNGVFYSEDSWCSFLGTGFNIGTGTDIIKGIEVQFENETPGDATFSWDFGDGGTSTEASPKHTYNLDPGGVTVSLMASIGSCTVTVSKTLVILPDPFVNYFVSVPGGSFMMGCTAEQNGECDEDEDPVHSVTIQPFLIGKTEITQGQWTAIMGSNPSFFSSCGLDCPVETVSWNEIQVFISKLNATLPPDAKPFRLPSESEWEYAARGNEGFKYAGSNNIDAVAWNSGNSGDSTHPVMGLAPNAFGLYDMSGNVYEFTEDFYHDDYNGAPQDGTPWLDSSQSTERVQRSGAYRLDTNNCRTSNRSSSTQSEKFSYIGFRLARSL